MFGVPQSGKSRIAREISARWSRSVTADPKAEPELVPPNARVVHSGTEGAAALPGRVVWWPPIAGARAWRDDFDKIVARVMDLRRSQKLEDGSWGGPSHGVCIHEGHALYDEQNGGDAMSTVLLQGPALRIPVVACFQEAFRIWVPFLTTATIVIVTYLEHDQLAYLSRRLSAPELMARDGQPPDFSFTVYRRADPSQGIAGSVVVHRPLA